MTVFIAKNPAFGCQSTMLCYVNVSCMKRFIRYGHYAGEVEDTGLIIARLTVVS